MFSLKRPFVLRVVCLLGIAPVILGSQGQSFDDRKSLVLEKNLTSPVYQHNFGSPVYQVASKKSLETRRSAFPKAQSADDCERLLERRKDQHYAVTVYDSDSERKK